MRRSGTSRLSNKPEHVVVICLEDIIPAFQIMPKVQMDTF